MTLESLAVKGTRLEAAWFGPPPDQAATLVLLHEGLGCVALWKAFPQHLAELTGCGVLAYSRAGYGASDPVTLPRPLSYMHEEAREILPRVLDAANVQRAVLVGHSDGASIALINAATVVDPRVRGLVLIAPHVFTEPIGLDSIRGAREAYQSGPLRERLARYHRHVDVAFRGWNEAWLDPDFATWNLRGFIPGIHCPSLLLQGRQDQYGTHKQLDAIEADCSGPCRVVWLDHCGHSPHREQPEATLETIRHFVTDLGLTGFPPT
ncbi:hydrolase or acyltransferase [Alcanivorax xiamenensis]|uniref:Hydrolase or acyltransferase n=1 Tax=Alcanivorax xiamenensis TaxID=1177156 RepID=A0ABQ6Y6X6_9GAMM|nr:MULTISPECIES: alpha/beta hydrolase [Alcanivorax]KAF0805159.1 hydrolase or acyltransferase [Alcanivorax xiamenensis]